eukprot:COSAG06_NODE_8990_length_2017_cov_16.215328_3_plen_95_part_01
MIFENHREFGRIQKQLGHEAPNRQRWKQICAVLGCDEGARLRVLSQTGVHWVCSNVNPALKAILLLESHFRNGCDLLRVMHAPFERSLAILAPPR